MQNTYGNLRQRYGELFRAHVELTERIRLNTTSGDDHLPTSSTTRTKNSVAATTAVNLSTEIGACTSTTGISGPLLFVSHKGDSPYDWGRSFANFVSNSESATATLPLKLLLVLEDMG